MPSWNQTKADLDAFPKTPQGGVDVDGFRRSKYKALASHTGRPLVVYATDFLNKTKVQVCQNDVNIDLSDREGVKEVTHGLDGDAVDFLIQSPGGSPDAADTIVQALRRRFKHVRIIVPGVAKSAATMIALSGHELLLESDAELGPIDPQMGMRRGDGIVWAPAQAIIDQFEKAQKILGADPTRIGAWIPILQQYGPALYQECLNAIALSKRYVRAWLVTGMLKHEPPVKRSRVAARVVNYLGNHNRFKTHGARVGLAEIRSTTLGVKSLNDDGELCERVMAVHQAIQWTFSLTGAFRMWENSEGGAYLRIVQQQMAPIMLPFQGVPGMPKLPGN